MSPGSPRRLGLPRESRLLRSRDFARIKTEGSRVVCGCLIMNWLPTPRAQHSRLGVVTGRRLGKAHDRNRARRLLREVFRRHQHALVQPVDLVLVARASIVGKRYADVERDYLHALRRAGLLRRES